MQILRMASCTEHIIQNHKVLSVGAALPSDSPPGLRPTDERDGDSTVCAAKGQTLTGTDRHKYPSSEVANHHGHHAEA